MPTTKTRSTPATGRCLATCLASLLLLHAGDLAAQTTFLATSPADRARLEGSTSSSYPLGRHDTRFQQLYGDIGGVTTIKGHAWRREGLGSRGSIAAFKSRMQVALSRTTVRPQNASSKFAGNVGTGRSVVLPEAWVSFPTSSRPTVAPGTYQFPVPYLRPFTWSGKDTLCIDLTIRGNQLSTGVDKNFGASLDAHTTYVSGRNVQPGYRFGAGCKAVGQSSAAYCNFEIRHLGQNIDLSIGSRNGVKSTAAAPAQSILLLSPTRRSIPWPPGTGCTLVGQPSAVLPLAGSNTSSGAWSGAIDVGTPPPPFFEMIGQILSMAPGRGETVLSDGSRLIAPPAGAGVVSSRVIAASDHTAASGSVSFAVPVTGFF